MRCMHTASVLCFMQQNVIRGACGRWRQTMNRPNYCVSCNKKYYAVHAQGGARLRDSSQAARQLQDAKKCVSFVAGLVLTKSQAAARRQ